MIAEIIALFLMLMVLIITFIRIIIAIAASKKQTSKPSLITFYLALLGVFFAILVLLFVAYIDSLPYIGIGN